MPAPLGPTHPAWVLARSQVSGAGGVERHAVKAGFSLLGNVQVGFWICSAQVERSPYPLGGDQAKGLTEALHGIEIRRCETNESNIFYLDHSLISL